MVDKNKSRQESSTTSNLPNYEKEVSAKDPMPI